MRCGFVAIIGPPNAGKSTLANALVGQKIAIVTHKVQTTRMAVRAVVMHDSTQIILVDTPGIFAPRRGVRLDAAMVRAAWNSAGDADAIAVVLDASRPLPPQTDLVLDGIAESGKAVFLVLNKIDAVARPKLLELSAKLNARANFTATLMVSAKSGDGLGDVQAVFADAMPQGAWHYPPDQAADIPSKLLAAEITREKLMLRLHQELPYALMVETETWRRAKGGLRIEQVIFVKRAGQKALVLGKGGRTIKAIGAEARAELEQIFDCKVHLFLFVKQRARWADDPARYRAQGLDFGAG